ncbi:MAG: undecaprenyl-diphosphate phosphatase [Coprococcus phoceensis]
MLIEILKAVLFGIVEGITEWLPISSTGHMILVDQFVHLNVSADFYKMFEVVIQLGCYYGGCCSFFWNKLWPFHMKNRNRHGKMNHSVCGSKLLLRIPAAIIGCSMTTIDELFYHPCTGCNCTYSCRCFIYSC